MSRLLMPSDPKPAWKKQGDQNVPLLIVCDHASNVVPQSLSNLGVSKETLSTHIAWDIGARRVAEEIIERVGG